ncbi:hypothetical protein FOZ60_008120 [Perkinsus olseni]|uniref:Chitinase n=1 Tax=Perkinsus olseni TaxID=32597 RepID=A0A7J6NK57_PEROL|nr:hypothetical protein FOZ60_008120 [Perkinsus olseni]
MRNPVQFVYYILGCSVMEVIASSANPVHFYKEVKFPWDVKEDPTCSNSTLCPTLNYTWQFYFDKLLGMGVKNFVFGGYAIKQNSTIRLDWEPFGHPWDEKEFEYVKRRSEEKGGKILADFGLYRPATLHRTTFLSSAKDFVKRYPVDGFRLDLWLNDLDENIKVVREVLDITKKLGLETALRFMADEWQIVKKEGLGTIADTYFSILWPSCDKSSPPFNSNQFAKKVITNATQAGVHPNTFVLEIPLFVPFRVCNVGGYGYSEAVYDAGADPRGNGSLLYFYGYHMDPPLYFFSQPRAVEKVDLADKSGLHGIMLQGDDISAQDLYPWDKGSLLYALAKKSK